MKAGDIVGEKYKLTRRIGKGANGIVWEATHTETEKAYALKLLLQTADADQRERLLREGRACQRIHHPNVVEVVDVAVEGDAVGDGTPFLVMPLLQGRTLAEALLGKPIPLAESVRYLRDIGRGLVAAHGADVVHRDLKPQNVFLHQANGEGDVEVKIVDFGISRIHTKPSSLTGADRTLGSPQYMAPEQLVGSKVDQRADLWSFGVIAFQMFARRLPFTGGNVLATLTKVQSGEIPKLPPVDPSVDAVLSKLVASCLVRELDARVQTASECVDVLDGLLVTLANAPVVEAAAEPPPAPETKDEKPAASVKPSIGLTKSGLTRPPTTLSKPLGTASKPLGIGAKPVGLGAKPASDVKPLGAASKPLGLGSKPPGQVSPSANVAANADAASAPSKAESGGDASARPAVTMTVAQVGVTPKGPPRTLQSMRRRLVGAKDGEGDDAQPEAKDVAIEPRKPLDSAIELDAEDLSAASGDHAVQPASAPPSAPPARPARSVPPKPPPKHATKAGSASETVSDDVFGISIPAPAAVPSDEKSPSASPAPPPASAETSAPDVGDASSHADAPSDPDEKKLVLTATPEPVVASAEAESPTAASDADAAEAPTASREEAPEVALAASEENQESVEADVKSDLDAAATNAVDEAKNEAKNEAPAIDAPQVGDALFGAGTSEERSASEASPMEFAQDAEEIPAPPRTSKKPLFIGAAVAAVLVLVVVIVSLSSGSKPETQASASASASATTAKVASPTPSPTPSPSPAPSPAVTAPPEPSAEPSAAPSAAPSASSAKPPTNPNWKRPVPIAQPTSI